MLVLGKNDRRPVNSNKKYSRTRDSRNIHARRQGGCHHRGCHTQACGDACDGTVAPRLPDRPDNLEEPNYLVNISGKP